MTASEIREELAAAQADLARVSAPAGRIVDVERLRERQETCAWWVSLYERELAEMNCAVVAHN